MKEMIVRVSDEKAELLASIMEKLGFEIVKLKSNKRGIRKKEPRVKLRTEVTKKDHTYLSNKLKDVDIDVKKLRK